MGRKRKEDTQPTKTVTKTFRLHKVQYDFHHSKALYRSFMGGIGCLAPETILGGVPVGDLTSSAGECQTLLGASPRSPSFCKGKDDLYRVTMESGRTVLVTLGHRFLTPKGWLPLSKLGIGFLLASDGSEGGLRDWGKSTNWKGDYSREPRRDGEQLHPIQAFCLDKIRQSFGQTCGSHSIRSGICRPSIVDSLSPTHSRPFAFEPHGEPCVFGPLQDQHQSICQGPLLTCHPYTGELLLDRRICALRHCQSCQSLFQVCEERMTRLPDECQASWRFAPGSCNQTMYQESAATSTLHQGEYPYQEGFLDTQNNQESYFLRGVHGMPYINAFWDKIQDISFERYGEYYDLTVPELEHYSANGIYHHNSGKSWIGAYDLLKRAMAPDMANRMFMVVAPTYILMKDASQRTLLQLGDELGVIRERFKQPPEIILNNGAIITFRSGEDPDKLRGPNISGIWLDEASLMSKDVWDIAIGRLREGGEAGFITATFTPKGMSHWTYDEFGKGDKPNREFFRSKTMDNPFLPKEFIEAVKSSYDDKNAQQELDGEFISMDGVEWPNEYFGEHIWVDSMPEGHDFTISTMALDPSKGKNSKHGDYSTTVKLGRSKDGLLYVDADLRRCDSETLIEFFVSQMADFYPDRVGIEVNQFQHLMSKEISKSMKRRNIDIPIVEIYNSINKEVRIRRLGPHLRNHKLRFVRNPGTVLLVSQLREFPLGKHDDGPDCLEMALRVMIQAWNNRQNIRTKGVKA